MVTICTTTEKLQHFATETIYVFHMILTINSLCFPTQHKTPGLYTGIDSVVCKVVSELLQVRVLQMSVSFQSVKKYQQ
jgi:hypothetical protein